MLQFKPVLCGAWLTTIAAMGGWGVGNGGDEIRLMFANAKEHASYITLRLQDRSLPLSLEPNLRQWILDHHVDLAADIAKSPHDWTLTEEQTCAWTQLTPAATIQLSYPTCHANIGGFDEIAQLLVHESVHHLGIENEAFADGVALAVYDAWQQGATDWVSVTTVGAPPSRYQHSAVWTGSEMVIFGGQNASGTPESDGFRYDPVKDSWAPIAGLGAPPRYGHQAIWTGTQMIVWGGYVAKPNLDGINDVKVWQNSGAIWDLASDSWQTLPTPYGPAELADMVTDNRMVQTMVWTGSEIIVFGGAPINGHLSGGIYNPSTHSWRELPADGAPGRIGGHSAVWAGDRMIVWGGLDLGRNQTSTGASLASGVWTPLPTTGAPSQRDAHTAVWTGTQMIVFGGFDTAAEPSGTGGLYDLQSNSWKGLRTEAVPARLEHAAVWTGSEMLIFGGKAKHFGTYLYNAVSAFNPANMTWRVIDSASAPSARRLQSAVWTGSQMIVFGGAVTGGSTVSSGAVFYP